MPENKTPQQLKREREYRKRSAGVLAVGSTVAGAGAGVNMMADKYMERKQIQKPLRAALKGKLNRHHAVYLGGRGIGRSLQIAGIPMAAAGAYGVYKPKKIAQIDANRHIKKPIVDAVTFKTEAERGRKMLNTVLQTDKFGKAVTGGNLTTSEHEELARRKQRAKRLSQISGTLGAAALALRAPEAAKLAARKIPKAAPKLQRFANYEPQATKLSNTLGIGAIGVGSAGSFNFARIQGAEAKAEQRAIGKAAYFKNPQPLETYAGTKQRRKAEAAHQGYRAASLALAGLGTAASGSYLAGSKYTPEVVRAAEKAARSSRVPKKLVGDTASNISRVHEWAKPRRGKLLAAASVAGLGAASARTMQRWKRNEVAGLSTSIGNAQAGRTYKKTRESVQKDAGTILSLSAMKRYVGSLKNLSSPRRAKVVRDGLFGVAGVTAGGYGVKAARDYGNYRNEKHQLVKKAEQPANNDRKKKIAAGAAIAGGLAVTPVPMRIPNASNRTNRRITEQASTGKVDPRVLQRVSTGPGGRFGESRRVAQIAQSLQGGFDPDKPVEVTRYRGGQHVLTGGHHRVEAAQRLGMSEVPTKIIDRSGKSARTWVPLISARKYKRDVQANRERVIKPQHPKQIAREANSYMPAWKDKVNNIKSAAEDFARSKNSKYAAGAALVGAGIYGGAKLKERMSKSDQIIWVNTPEQQAAVLAKNPDARVMMRPPKKKSGETKAQRAARQAAQPKPVVINKPSPAAVQPSTLHRLSGKKFPGGRLGAGAVLIGAGAGLGAGYGALKKSDSKEKARNAALGAAGTYGAYLGAGYGLSAMAQRARGKDKASQKAMFQHRKDMGIAPTGSLRSAASKKQIEQYNRTMPANVKYSGLTRTLARTHGVSPFGRMAVPVALAGAAAPLAYDRVKKADDKFLRKYKNNISPSAEQGYRYLKRGRNEAVGLATLNTGLGAWSAMDAAKAIGAKRYGAAALQGGLAGANAYFAGKNAKKAQRWNDKMGKIKSKAVERNKAGVLGRDRQVDVAKAFMKTNPRFGMAFPKGLRRKPAVRDGGIRRTPTGKIVTVRGSIG